MVLVAETVKIYYFIIIFSQISINLYSMIVFIDFFQVISFGYWFSVDTTITKREWAAVTQ